MVVVLGGGFVFFSFKTSVLLFERWEGDAVVFVGDNDFLSSDDGGFLTD